MAIFPQGKGKTTFLHMQVLYTRRVRSSQDSQAIGISRRKLEPTSGLVFADVFFPEFGMAADEASQEIDAFAGVEVNDGDAILAEPLDATLEVDGFADQHGADAKLADEAAAIPAGRKRGDHDFVAIPALASGAAKGVGFAVDGRIAFLNASVVALAEKFSR